MEKKKRKMIILVMVLTVVSLLILIQAKIGWAIDYSDFADFKKQNSITSFISHGTRLNPSLLSTIAPLPFIPQNGITPSSNSSPVSSSGQSQENQIKDTSVSKILPRPFRFSSNELFADSTKPKIMNVNSPSMATIFKSEQNTKDTTGPNLFPSSDKSNNSASNPTTSQIVPATGVSIQTELNFSGTNLRSKTRLNGEVHSYQSSYVKNFTVESSVSNGELDYEEEYGPAVYYLLKDEEGDVLINERAMALADGDAKEFIHPIKGAETYEDLDEANKATCNQLEYKTDEELYDVNKEEGEDAWANPEEALSKGAGDCEEHAFVLVSYGRFHLVGPLSEDEIYTGICTFEYEGETMGHADVVRFNETETAIYEPTGGWKRNWLFPEEQYYLFFNDENLIWVN